MADKVFLNADRSAVVDRFEPGKKWMVSEKEAQRLGLLGDTKPQTRRTAQSADEEPKPQRRRTTRRKKG